MGQTIGRCGCFLKNEQEALIMANLSHENTRNNKFLVEKGSNQKESNEIKKNTFFHSIFTSNLPLNKPIPPEIKIQSLYRSYIYRKKRFPHLKHEYQLEENNFIKNKGSEFITPQIRNWEKNFEQKLLCDNCKTFYQENDDDIEKCRTGDKITKIKLYTTKTLIKTFDGNPSLYIGQTDINYDFYGEGVLYSSLGCKYEGSWVKGEFTGWGKYIDPEGNYYEGLFTCGVLNGKGVKISSNGSLYIGDFKNMKKNGSGREESNDNIYEGQFVNDKKEGKGELRYKINNHYYKGDFKDGNITGNGYYIWGNKNTYSGEFLNGKMHGRGVYKWPDGSEYEGEYINNIKEGYGIFKWEDGRIFKGPFIKGKPSGKGKMCVLGIEFDATFKDGKLLGDLREMYKKKKAELKAQNDIK